MGTLPINLYDTDFYRILLILHRYYLHSTPIITFPVGGGGWVGEIKNKANLSRSWSLAELGKIQMKTNAHGPATGTMTLC